MLGVFEGEGARGGFRATYARHFVKIIHNLAVNKLQKKAAKIIAMISLAAFKIFTIIRTFSLSAP